MAKVDSYTRRSIKGKFHKVKSHNRKATKRGDYNIDKKRQLSFEGDLSIDQMLKAKKPGKRKSKNKHIYYERRFNRSDEGEWL